MHTEQGSSLKMADKPSTQKLKRLAAGQAADGLPDAVWVTLTDAISWLATGRASTIRDLKPSLLFKTATGAAWKFLCDAGHAGKVTLSGIPWDGRSASMHGDDLGHCLSRKPEDIDPRFFSTVVSWDGRSSRQREVVRILGFGTRFKETPKHLPFLATAWSDVFVKRDTLARHAKSSSWVTPFRVSPPGEAIEGGVPVSVPRRPRADPKADEKVRETHQFLGRAARQLWNQDLSRADMATKLASDPRNRHDHSPETIKKMLAGTYKPFVKRRLPPLGTGNG